MNVWPTNFAIFLHFLIFIEFSSSFAPNRLFSAIASFKLNDKTHTTITEDGLDLVMKAYSKEKELDIQLRKTGMQGFLANMKSMAQSTVETMKKLVKSGHRSEPAKGSLENAIKQKCVLQLNAYHKAVKEIVNGNAKTDSGDMGNRADYHFDAEKFYQSNRNIRDMLELMLKYVHEHNYGKARESLGHALHTTQDFYAHSNWVELGNREKPSRALGTLLTFEYKIAPSNVPTCKDCRKITGQCKDNILVHDLLTSGYFQSAAPMAGEEKDRKGEDVPKPKNIGKCSHGGLIDRSSDKISKGGINKDTSNQFSSPHSHLHHTAAELAKRATVQLMSLVREKIKNDDAYEKLLGLDQPNCKSTGHQRSLSGGSGPKSADHVYFYMSDSSSKSPHDSDHIVRIEWANIDESRGDLIIPIDNTLDEFRVNVSAPIGQQATITITAPSKVQKKFNADFSKIDSFANIFVQMPEPGPWRIEMAAENQNGPYSINVIGVSPWDAVLSIMKYAHYTVREMDPQLVLVDPNEPIITASILFVEVVVPLKHANLIELELQTVKGTRIDSVQLMKDPKIELDLSKNIFQFTVPQEEFRFSIRGTDENGYEVRRASEKVYRPKKRDEL